MKTKKSSKNILPDQTTVAPKSDLDGPIMVNGEKHFSPKDVLRYELIQHKVVVAYQNVGLKQVEIERARATFESRLRVLDNDFKELQAEQTRKEAEFKLFQDNLAKTYAVDLSKITYDDISGRIIVHEPTEK